MTTRKPPGRQTGGLNEAAAATGASSSIFAHIADKPRPPRWTGCPMGCGPWHEWPCLVGSPIVMVADYLDGAVWVGSPPRLSSLREQVAA